MGSKLLHAVQCSQKKKKLKKMLKKKLKKLNIKRLKKKKLKKMVTT